MAVNRQRCSRINWVVIVLFGRWILFWRVECVLHGINNVIHGLLYRIDNIIYRLFDGFYHFVDGVLDRSPDTPHSRWVKVFVRVIPAIVVPVLT